MSLFNSVSIVDKALFAKHLSIMIKSGMTLSEAIPVLIDKSTKSGMRGVLQNVMKDVAGGLSLAKALGKHPHVFDQLFIGLIEAGEQSGTLQESLVFLADQLTREKELRQKVQGALLYPAMVLIAALVMGMFISLYLLPQLLQFFTAFQVELPLATKVLLAIARYMSAYGVITFVGLFVGAVVFINAMQLSAFKSYWHAFLLKLPLLGSFLGSVQCARLNRNLGVLLKAGLPLPKALHITRNTLSNEQFKNLVKRVEKKVSAGDGIADGLEGTAGLVIPQLMIKMIQVGEKSGTLDEVLVYLGDFFEDEVEVQAKNFTTFLEPALLLSVGLAVGFLALAVISPIYELTGSIRR